MINRICLTALIFAVSACAVQDEAVLEEPMVMEEEVVRTAPIADCKIGDDDGIGGTGCEPVARSALDF